MDASRDCHSEWSKSDREAETPYDIPYMWNLKIQRNLFAKGEGNGTPLQYSCLENPMDGEVRWAAVHGVAKSWTRLSDFPFTIHFPALEKEMATHSSVLAWRIPGTGEPGGLPFMVSHRVGHNWSNLAAIAAAHPGIFLKIRKMKRMFPYQILNKVRKLLNWGR